MTLTVTPGSPTADSFVSSADFLAYCNRVWPAGWDGCTDYPTETMETALRRATNYLSTGYQWKGYRTSGRSQALAWPRAGATDGEGEDIASTEIPIEIVNACCEIAVREIVTPGYTNPDVVLADRIKSEAIDTIRTEYVVGSNTAEASRPVMLIVDAMIAGLIAGSSNHLVGTAVRS